MSLLNIDYNSIFSENPNGPVAEKTGGKTAKVIVYDNKGNDITKIVENQAKE